MQRFWSKVQKPDGGCWIWTACKDRKGCDRFRIKAETVLAHRFSHQEAKGSLGRPDVDHLCRNPSCVNLDHLEAVTRGENTRRGSSFEASRPYQSSKIHCPQGYMCDEANTYVYVRENGRVNRQCRARHRERFHARKRGATC